MEVTTTVRNVWYVRGVHWKNYYGLIIFLDNYLRRS